MAKVEDITEEDEAGPSQTKDSSSPDQLNRVLNQLSARLALPEDLLPSFLNEDKPPEALLIYRDQAYETLQRINAQVQSSTWSELDLEDQAEVIFQVVRLYGTDTWTGTAIRGVIDDITKRIDSRSIAIKVLSSSLRNLFSTPHPMLSDTTRALSRPIGGPDASLDFQDASVQPWKTLAGWGSHNALSWCLHCLDGSDIQDHIGVILPPTLTMMDDWESPWRGRGIQVLGNWIGKVEVGWMKRMGMDKLLMDSLIHTLSLHPSPPLPHVLSVTLQLLSRTAEGEKRAKRVEEIMDKGIIQGWMYAKSGLEGRDVLIQVAKDLETLCDELGAGIARWLKTIIPNLLQPLQFSPTPAVLPHFQANLRALLKVMVVLRDTGRISMWRGKILHLLGILWTQLDERRLMDEPEEDNEINTRNLIIQVIQELANQSPSIRKIELPQLLEMDKRTFARLVDSIA